MRGRAACFEEIAYVRRSRPSAEVQNALAFGSIALAVVLIFYLSHST